MQCIINASLVYMLHPEEFHVLQQSRAAQESNLQCIHWKLVMQPNWKLNRVLYSVVSVADIQLNTRYVHAFKSVSDLVIKYIFFYP